MNTYSEISQGTLQSGPTLPVVQMKVLRPQLKTFGLPQYATAGSAGLDLVACIDAAITLNPGETAFIPSGMAIFLANPQWAAVIMSRSGLGTKKGLVVKQGVGLVDSDYQGEITVAIHNIGEQPQVLQPGDRIAQLVIMPVQQVSLVEVAEFQSATQRGAGGFGSTGVASH